VRSMADPEVSMLVDDIAIMLQLRSPLTRRLHGRSPRAARSVAFAAKRLRCAGSISGCPIFRLTLPRSRSRGPATAADHRADPEVSKRCAEDSRRRDQRLAGDPPSGRPGSPPCARC